MHCRMQHALHQAIPDITTTKIEPLKRKANLIFLLTIAVAAFALPVTIFAQVSPPLRLIQSYRPSPRAPLN